MRDNYITKDKSQLLYGVGIFLMVYHHLFAFPERIHVPYVMLFDFSFLGIETMISYFGKFCVALYAFLSGYVLTLRVDGTKNIKDVFLIVLKQLRKFYITYFITIFTFIPLGIILGKLDFKIIEFVKNMIGISCTYNAEWWYVKQYVLMLLCFPFIIKCMSYIGRTKMKYMFYMLFYIVSTIYITYTQSGFYSYLLCFITGAIVNYEMLLNRIDKLKIHPIISLIILMIVFIIRTLFLGSNLYDYVIIVPFVYATLSFLNIEILKNTINKLLMFIGQYSKYIYYIHTFFIYYYFQSITFIPKYSILIFIWTLGICVIVSYILNRIEKGILNLRKRYLLWIVK